MNFSNKLITEEIKRNDVFDLKFYLELIKKYGKVIKGIGFSGHHIGTAVDISAYTLGATVIVRHFTLDKSLKGTDQKVALTKEEFEELILNIDNVRKALSYKNKDVLDVEIKNKEKLKW